MLDLAPAVVEGLLALSGGQDDPQGRLDYFVERMLPDLEKTWAPLRPVSVRLLDQQSDPLSLKVCPKHEIVALLVFEMNAKLGEGVLANSRRNFYLIVI